MKKFYTIASTLMLVLCMALMAACSSENDIVNDEPVVPEQPVSTRTVTLKATANMGAETRVAVEGIDGKEDAFRITGWKNGDVVTVFATLDDDSYEIPFTYNESTGEFTGEVDENFVTGGGKFVYAYVGNSSAGANYDPDQDSWYFELDIPIAISNPEDCFLFGNVDADQNTGDLSADLTAPYALACVHNNTAQNIEVGQIDNMGFYCKTVFQYDNAMSNTSDELAFEGMGTDDVEYAQKHTIAAHSKAYFVIPPKFDDGDFIEYYGLYDFTHSQIIAEPKENVTPGKVYKVQVNGPAAAWETPLTLGRIDYYGPTSIEIQTGVNVSSYTEDANHKPLNAAGTLWEVLDGSVLRIQTSEGKIKAHDSFDDGFGDYQGLFALYPAVETISGLDKLDMSEVTNMRRMFWDCSALTALDLRSWNTTNVTDMSEVFNTCRYLESIQLNGWNTSNVTNMKSMFYDCATLHTLDLSSFNTSKVTDIRYMFMNCSGLESLDLSNFNTSNVTNMYYMFNGCEALQSLVLGNNFTTSNVTDMSGMFGSCKALHALDLSCFTTSNRTSMNNMFRYCQTLESLTLGQNFNPGSSMISIFTVCGGQNVNGLTVYGANETFKNTINSEEAYLYGWDSNYMSFK